MTTKRKPFEDHIEECLEQPDPPRAFRSGMVASIQESHPNASAEIIEEMLDQMGA